MVFLKNQISLPHLNPLGNDYAYEQMYKNDKKNIDKNILKHSQYIDSVLKEKLFDSKKKKN